MKRLTVEPGKTPDICPVFEECNGQDTFFRVAIFGENSMDAPYDQDGSATHVFPSPDGYLVLGSQTFMQTDYRVGNSSVWAMKLAFDGTIAWQRQYAPAFFFNAIIDAVEAEGGALLALTESLPDEDVPTQDDVLLLKIDALGDIVWQKTLGAPEKNDSAYAVRKTRSGDFLVAGNSPVLNPDRTVSAALVTRVDGAGEILSQRLVRSKVPDYPFFYGTGAVETPDGGVALVGALYDVQDPVAVLKLDAGGTLLWQKAISDGAQGLVYVDAAPDGSLAVVSDWTDWSGSHDDVPEENQVPVWGMLVNRLSADGRLLWQRLVGVRADQYSVTPRKVMVGPDGGIYVLAAGWGHNSSDWSTKAMLFKFDDRGDLVWKRLYGLEMTEDFTASLAAASLSFDTDGGILITGGLRLDGWYGGISSGTNEVGMFLLKAGSDGRLRDGCPLQADGEVPVEVVEYLPADVEMELVEVNLPVRESRLSARPGIFTDSAQLCGMSLPPATE
ncbi:MAG: hypothetical protein GYA21_18515 [Myxococcales bacterium]|nr:hypothetical protein [Myxococcales bacterium]